MAILILPSQSLVLNAYAVLTGSTPGNASFKEHQAFIATNGVTAYKAALEGYASSVMTNAQLATALLTNLGLSTSFTQAQAEAFLTANPGNRVGAMMDLAAQLYGYNGTDAKLLASKAAYVKAIEGSFNYSNNTANINGQDFAATVVAGQTYTLTTGLDNLVGSAFGDTFMARSSSNANTLNDGDKIDGGAGADTLYVDFFTVGTAITPVLKNVETVVVRAQSAGTDNNGTGGTDGNNQLNNRTVQIDAQRSLDVSADNTVTAALGVTRWESSNSRSDVVIEDVRIGTTQKTKDITIAFRESDPGNVDYGVYFDQHSLRNASSGNTTIKIDLMDTGAAGAAATAATPLLNNPYDQFKFATNGILQTIQLDKVAVAAADTYPALLAVFQAALVGTNVTATLGANFTITDPISNLQVTGQSIVLSSAGGFAITAPTGSGWFNTTGAAVPATSNIYTTFLAGSSSVTELVTSTVILDDVGRGSTGGDLVIGGMSVGTTSTSRGVERFEITVEDSSKLQTINSTNNALREVTIVNGTTNNTTSAYNTVVANAGNLTVNGRVASGGDVPLVGVEAGLTAYNIHDNRGFTDVRLIDGSQMTGSLAFTAEITTDSLAKYVNLTDTGPVPTADVAGAGNVNFNVKGANFAYSGGANNDTMNVLIDSAVAASTTLTGQSDFSIVISGGAGNDTITTNFGGNQTAAWQVDQKRNANVTVDGGDGDDTITTTGAGAVRIRAGAGDDTVYADNSGAISVARWVVNAVGLNGVPDLADLQSNGAGIGAAFLYKGKLTVTYSADSVGGGLTLGAAVKNTLGFESTVNVPTGANYAVNQFYLNQAIKAAINDNAVLKKVLLAEDGPNNTLTIKSLLDGVFVANDLKITVEDGYLPGATEDAAMLAAFKLFSDNTAAVLLDATNANTAAITAGNNVLGMDVNQRLSAGAAGAISTVESDNTIDMNVATANDVAVLGTGAASNDTVVFTGYSSGKLTIVNFETVVATGLDSLNFRAYLTDQQTNVPAGNTNPSRIATTLNADATVEANSVTFVTSAVFTATETFAGLTTAKLLAAINTTGNTAYAGLADATLQALNGQTSAQLVGGIGHAVVLVENNLNRGEYAAFELTFNGAQVATFEFSAAKLIGIVDFGATAVVAAGNII